MTVASDYYVTHTVGRPNYLIVIFVFQIVQTKFMLEIAKIILPAFAVMLLALFFFDRLTDQKKTKYKSSKDVEREKVVLPLKIKAYERLILMMERFRPQGLVMRSNTGHMTAGQLQLEIMRNIREEFEHNISLQMYVSERVWRAVGDAKENALQLVKVASTKVQPESTAMELSQEIFTLQKKVGTQAIDVALKALNLEIKAQLQIER